MAYGGPIYSASLAADIPQSGSTLHIGNIHSAVDENVLVSILQQFFPGQGFQCKLFPDPNNSPDLYCFMTFADVNTATSALSILNGREVMGKKLKVSWASGGAGQFKQSQISGTTHSIYVGDLPHECDDNMLAQAFRPFGEVLSSRVVRDPESGLSKGFGFIVYRHQYEAEEAIQKMHGGTISSKSVKVSWATRSKATTSVPQLNYNDVYQQSGAHNTTLYVGNLPESMKEQFLISFFEPYGAVLDTKIFHDKHFAFIKMDTHEAAATSIVKCNGQPVDGCVMKVWWSRDNPNLQGNMPSNPAPQPTYMGSVPSSYGVSGANPSTMPYQSYYGYYNAAALAANPHLQQQYNAYAAQYYQMYSANPAAAAAAYGSYPYGAQQTTHQTSSPSAYANQQPPSAGPDHNNQNNQ
uniref:Nucleolysin TIA-1 n=1 Tax=Salmo salar TaxID=8030 RepID=B5XGE1_SALSA|nr:cytotoxic granule-associated RNA binding protein 1 [Salmo salar]ACI69911.1 Nucleolysin TIA-1 [Salmo salar]